MNVYKNESKKHLKRQAYGRNPLNKCFLIKMNSLLLIKSKKKYANKMKRYEVLSKLRRVFVASDCLDYWNCSYFFRIWTQNKQAKLKREESKVIFIKKKKLKIHRAEKYTRKQAHEYLIRLIAGIWIYIKIIDGKKNIRNEWGKKSCN